LGSVRGEVRGSAALTRWSVVARSELVLERRVRDLRAWTWCYLYLAKVRIFCVEGESLRGARVSAEKCLERFVRRATSAREDREVEVEWSEARSHSRKAHVSAGIDMRKVRFDLTRGSSRAARDVHVSRGTEVLVDE
jgi:hypothetical protein